jgi:prepilin-type processing-associated H-X9-DG protein
MTRKEVVVIVVVIGILGCLLVPALQKAKIRCISSNCISNLSQLGMASVLYGIDNNNCRPGPQPMGAGCPSISWDRLLAVQMGANFGEAGVYEPLAKLTHTHPSFKTLRNFTCAYDPLEAGARLIPEVPGSLADGTAPGIGICRSYVLNLGSGNLVSGIDDGVAPAADAIPFKKIEVAPGTVQLIESQGYATVVGQRNITNDTHLTCDRATGAMSPKGAITDSPAPFHKFKTTPTIPRANVLMYDGHVELLDQATITADGGKIMQYHKQTDKTGPIGQKTAAKP